jgi:hypothetical protein
MPSKHDAVTDLIRDRVVELRRMRAGELLDHPLNWRAHTEKQGETLEAVLREVGWAGAALAYPRDEDGKLVLIDGHLRKQLHPDRVIPVLVTDLNDAEALKLLLSYDYIGTLAGFDKALLVEAQREVAFEEPDLQALMSEMAAKAGVLDATDDADGREYTEEDAKSKSTTCPACGYEWIK